LNIHWLAGFINADGPFGLYVQPNNSGVGKFIINITQHHTNLALLQALCDFLGIGKVYPSNKSVLNYKKFSINGVNTFINKFKEAQ